MDKELVLWWDGQERVHFSYRVDDGSIVETNRRAKPLRVPQGAKIKTVEGDLVGTVDRVTGAGASRYDIHYTAPAPAPKKRRREKPEPVADAPVADADDFLAMAREFEVEVEGGAVGNPDGEAEAL